MVMHAQEHFSMASPTELSKRQFIILRTLHCCNG